MDYRNNSNNTDTCGMIEKITMIVFFSFFSQKENFHRLYGILYLQNKIIIKKRFLKLFFNYLKLNKAF